MAIAVDAKRYVQLAAYFGEHQKKFFAAGKDRFLLVNPPKMPADQTLLVGGEILKDSASPMELKVVDFRPVTP